MRCRFSLNLSLQGMLLGRRTQEEACYILPRQQIEKQRKHAEKWS